MINPTRGNETQFTAPFDILPNVIYTNPSATLSDDAPFNLLPDEDYKPKNPTITGNSSQFSQKNSDTNKQAAAWQAPGAKHTNMQIGNGEVLKSVLGFASLSAASVTGIPQINQVINGTLSLFPDTLSAPYSTLPLDKLHRAAFIELSDFRARINITKDSDTTFANQAASYLTTRRLDGASSVLRGSYIGAAYAAASATPLGAYSVFNLNGNGKTGYGWGFHDAPDAIRSDFTMQSHVTTRWNSTKRQFVSTLNPVELATPFRGDRVTVIDFGKRTERDAYKWKPSLLNNIGGAVGAALDTLGIGGITQDFIKFYFTGPKLHNGRVDDETDDIIVFRATINSLSDSFQANWTPITMIGRADPNYQYTGYNRDVSLDFIVYATDRDELKPIYRKLNAMAGFMAPTYLQDSIAMQAPWMRITVGDLFRQQPAILTSLDYTLHDSDTTWEINIEKDPTMMEVPHKIAVRCAFTMIGDYLPEKGGRFYSLAHEYDATGTPLEGNRNWLSDSSGNAPKVDTSIDPNLNYKGKRNKQVNRK